MPSIVDALNRGARGAFSAVAEAGGTDPSIPLLLGAILAGGLFLALSPAR